MSRKLARQGEGQVRELVSQLAQRQDREPVGIALPIEGLNDVQQFLSDLA